MFLLAPLALARPKKNSFPLWLRKAIFPLLPNPTPTNTANVNGSLKIELFFRYLPLSLYTIVQIKTLCLSIIPNYFVGLPLYAFFAHLWNSLFLCIAMLKTRIQYLVAESVPSFNVLTASIKTGKQEKGCSNNSRNNYIFKIQGSLLDWYIHV